ncbi:MAG: SusD/RagB family nutrient-binding outer membrane lipoprotein [Proteiniphilum sp.]|nr:SusD/RagB family nutrient-binding outer membrane lipoprotein [Proteiniphilum sp.]MDD3909897.1 SusD/RagB family nutrient-binding outer membrane lipoprotein [Proteiniphilum sp.]MDD4415686.1 SusD/RagB family nutrient-binding outer membrane lipoprotein [Proteiniphilum sp.]
MKTSDILTDEKYALAFKSKNYLGIRYDEHWATYTNDPYTGFFIYGLPYSVDPRFFNIYALPCDDGHSYNANTKSFDLVKVGEAVPEEEKPTVVATVNVEYAVNGFNSGDWGDAGAAKGVLNNQLSKIITQKYIAQLPWLPLEAWCDHRRLGLPFFDNPLLCT